MSGGKGLVADLATTVIDYTEHSGLASAACPTDVDGLVVMQARETTRLTPTLYEPVVCLILQGAKELQLGARSIRCGPGESVIVSHTLPIASRIIRATHDEPYAAMILRLDLGVLRGLVDDMADEAPVASPSTTALVVDRADPPLVDAMSRLFALRADATEARVLAPLVRREIHFRLLTASHGGMLRTLLNVGSQASRISRAIAHIRRGFREPLTIPDLAAVAHMSPSSFHQHFRSVTATTPLRYQKDLRLLEARRLLVEERRSVTEAAVEVGYQSPTQFSREYARKFGAPPRDDKARALAAA